jgi:hypothetical protein
MEAACFAPFLGSDWSLPSVKSFLSLNGLYSEWAAAAHYKEASHGLVRGLEKALWYL